MWEPTWMGLWLHSLQYAGVCSAGSDRILSFENLAWREQGQCGKDIHMHINNMWSLWNSLHPICPTRTLLLAKLIPQDPQMRHGWLALADVAFRRRRKTRMAAPRSNSKAPSAKVSKAMTRRLKIGEDNSNSLASLAVTTPWRRDQVRLTRMVDFYTLWWWCRPWQNFGNESMTTKSCQLTMTLSLPHLWCLTMPATVLPTPLGTQGSNGSGGTNAKWEQWQQNSWEG